MQASMLAPPAMLVLWSLVMLGWLAIVRFRAMANSRITILAPGGRGQDLDTVLPRAANWPAHNYTHLMEQPTLFYAIALTLALLGAGDGINLTIAWAYALALMGVLLSIIDNISDALGDPGLRDQISAAFGDTRTVGRIFLLISLVTIVARLRSLKRTS